MKQLLVAPYWGVRTRVDPGTDTVARAMAFAIRMPPRAFYFGRTTAALLDLPIPRRFSSETALHVGVRAGDRRVEIVGVVPHHVRVDARDVVSRRGVQMTSPERTWCDLAVSLSLPELVAAGDRLIWRRNPLALETEVRGCVERYEGRRGARMMRTALALLSDASDSAPESEIRIAIALAGFPAPAVNAEVRLSTGQAIHPDLSWPKFRIAIEYEGDHHRTDRGQWNRDIQRFASLADDGWRTYRATAEDYRSPRRLLLWLARQLPQSAH